MFWMLCNKVVPVDLLESGGFSIGVKFHNYHQTWIFANMHCIERSYKTSTKEENDKKMVNKLK